MPSPNRTLSPRVLLVFPWGGDRSLSVNTLPPLGILGIAASLEGKGISVDVIDQAVQPEARIDPLRYDLVGFSLNIANREAGLSAIRTLKKANPLAHIVVGGSLCLSDPYQFSDNADIDAVFACEGEEALHEYLTAEDKSKVKGLLVRDGEKMISTGVRTWIENLDTLPFPALHKVPIRRYNNFPKRGFPVASMMTSRGCPYGCIFCSHAMGRKWRARSAKHVLDEIRWQVKEFGVREICIYDDNFSLNRLRAEQICDALIAERLPVKLQFSNGLRADNVDYELLLKLKKAGTWLIGLAPEVGSPEVMKKLKKGFDHEAVRSARESCRRIGIKTHGFYMVGFPFENRADIRSTIELAKEIDTEIVEFNKVVPYPRTELYDSLKSTSSLLQDPWIAAKSYHDGTIETHRVGDIPMEEIKEIIRGAYRAYYLRPRKMVDLLRTFSMRDLLQLSIYALKTKNI